MTLASRSNLPAKSPVPARRSRQKIEAVVLDILARAHVPMSAYDIAHQAMNLGQPVLANQVYRTLRHLTQKNLVLRVESLSAYLIRQDYGDACLICAHCGDVQQVSAGPLHTTLAGLAGKIGFHADRAIVEIRGFCAACVAGAQRNRSVRQAGSGRAASIL